ncbi:type I secretion system permease/ATPase [Afifella sp. H1R]|uniref:type I secretion system permease/ATPase n=1 Tax=Afifella sp. H1R TaxID=2908841 RepID=UPI001F3D8592|nr:type I secretion system permease/ATPase [Afifella sp. H1R]MCF1504924.1 type I secretion system permease/ATPase [Afifella sp. H1R]
MTELDHATSSVRRAFIGVFIMSGITSVLMLALPFYMMQVFQRVLPSRSEETLIALSILAFIAFATYGIFEALRMAVLARAAARYEAMLAGPVVYAHFLDGSRDASSGMELMQDVRQVKTFIGSRALAAVAEAPFIPIFVAVLFMVDIALGILITCGMVVMVVVAILQQRAMKRGIEVQNDAQRGANRILQSHIEQSETVRVLGLQKTAIARWGSLNARGLTAFVNLQTVGALFGGFSRFMRFSLQASILGVGAFLALEGDVAAVVVFACMMLGGRALAPLDGLVGSWSALTNAWSAHNRVRDALIGFYVEPERTALPEPKGNFMVEKLVFGVRGSDEAIIKRISFGIEAGETIGIIGPSGAGKSTLLRLLAGGLMPNAGHVRLDGADMRNWNRIQLGEYMGYVPQAVDFFPGTIGENIARFDPDASDTDIVEAAQQAGIHEMILRFPRGYDTRIGTGGMQPSGGQKQLIALARALYRNPRLIFLDEPNSNLDQEGDHILLGAVSRAKARGATIILVTQRPVLLQVVDRVLLMKNGTIENYGPRQEVLPKVVKPASVERRPVRQIQQPKGGEEANEKTDGQVAAGAGGSAS